MPKYQIILSSAEQLSDQEFRERFEQKIVACDYCECVCEACSYRMNENYTILDVRSLEGIKEELWKKQKIIIERIFHAEEPMRIVEESFEEIKELFLTMLAE